jgi:hypothetical protein
VPEIVVVWCGLMGFGCAINISFAMVSELVGALADVDTGEDEALGVGRGAVLVAEGDNGALGCAVPDTVSWP